MTNDITAELAKLHELKGGEYSLQVERIALRREFHPIENEKGIYSTGGKQSDDYENLLQAARKAIEFGYKVYLLPNPTEIRTPDLILEKKGVYRVLLTSDIKTYFEVNKEAIEVLIFKGKKRLSVKRRLTQNPSFYSVLKKMYEK